MSIELKVGKHIAFTSWDDKKYTGHRIGKITKIIGNKFTVKLSNGVKMRINRNQIEGIIWFKKIRKVKKE